MVIDLSRLTPFERATFMQLAKEEYHAKLRAAMLEQTRAARMLRNSPPVWCDGLGEKTMAVHKLAQWCAFQKYGDDAREQDFWDWVRKKDEVYRVKSVSNKTQVGYRRGGIPLTPALSPIGGEGRGEGAATTPKAAAKTIATMERPGVRAAFKYAA